MEKKEIEDIHPLTIINDRYGGCYSGGAFLAFNLEPWDIPKGVDGSDIDCLSFWKDESEEYVIGKGDSIQEATEDLANKLKPAITDANKEKYLFLDFDGVLNTGSYSKQMKREGIDPFDEYIMRMRELWEERELPGEIFSMTPILLSTSYQDAMTGEMIGLPQRESKALEINAWLYKYAGKEYRYAILDDEDLFFPKQQEHLVLTDEFDGLTERKAQRVIWILNN